MPDINITVAHKVAVSDTQSIVCDNSDYAVHWTLDEDWSAYDTKTMRTIYMDGTYEDTVFSGDVIALPVCTVPGAVQIGLFAGDIRTSRVAILRALPSVRSAAGAPADPTESVYDQLMERMAQLETSDWAQNDPTAKDYVRNRTHYVSQENRVVFPETSISVESGKFFDIVPEIAEVPAPGSLWTAIFDGETYTGTVREVDGAIVCGNAGIVVSTEDDTGEPFAVARVGGISAARTFVREPGNHTISLSVLSDLVHTLDPKYIGEISGETLSVTGTVEFASDSWASDYSYFTDSWLTMNANSAKISIEINGKLVEDLPYSPGEYGAFTLGNVDTLGVAITNSGRGTPTQQVTVSTTVFPNGIKAARVFRKIAYRIPVDSLPEVISWIAKRTEDEFVLTGNRKFVNDNEATQVTDTVPSYESFDVYDHDLMLLKCHTGMSFFDMSNTNKISVRYGTGSNTETVDVLMPDGTPVTADKWPKGATLLGQDRTHKVYLLNPRSGVGIDITGATVGQIAKIAAVDSDGKPTAWSPADMPTGGGGRVFGTYDYTVLASGVIPAGTVTTEGLGTSYFDTGVTVGDLRGYRVWACYYRCDAGDQYYGFALASNTIERRLLYSTSNAQQIVAIWADDDGQTVIPIGASGNTYCIDPPDAAYIGGLVRRPMISYDGGAAITSFGTFAGAADSDHIYVGIFHLNSKETNAKDMRWAITGVVKK